MSEQCSIRNYLIESKFVINVHDSHLNQNKEGICLSTNTFPWILFMYLLI